MFRFFFALPLTLLLCACSSDLSLPSRFEEANNIATKGQMTRENIPAGAFTLASWKKINGKEPIHIYIEGDGFIRLNAYTPSDNPTPINPVAFKLATLDSAPNVIYLARPCQYMTGSENNSCPSSYWTHKRYSPEVIESFNIALDQIKSRYQTTGFHLIGFSGGANIAGLIAERRTDILSLRTVAGNIDTDYFNKMHNANPMPDSLNMATHAPLIAQLPQRHFIGGQDKTVPNAVFESYRHMEGSSHCTSMTLIESAEHTKGWTEHWADLLKLPVDCSE